MSQPRTMSYAEAATRGGLTTLLRHGREHFKRMSELGKAARRPKFDRAAIVARYQAGESITQISAATGASHCTVQGYVRDAGATRTVSDAQRLAWARRKGEAR